MPRLDAAVVAREEHVGHVPALERCRSCVVRILEAAFESVREALVLTRPVCERAREPPRDRIEQHHRGQLATRQHVRADRDGIGAEVLHDPLVEPLEPRREERDVTLGGELLDERLVERSALWGECDDPGRPPIAVHGLERLGDDVHAKNHPGAAAVGRVVDLACAERRRIAVVVEPELELAAEHGRERLLLGHPPEGVRQLREDVDAHDGRGYRLHR